MVLHIAIFECIYVDKGLFREICQNTFLLHLLGFTLFTTKEVHLFSPNILFNFKYCTVSDQIK